jgi:TPR repeat protein
MIENKLTLEELSGILRPVLHLKPLDTVLPILEDVLGLKIKTCDDVMCQTKILLTFEGYRLDIRLLRQTALGCASIIIQFKAKQKWWHGIFRDQNTRIVRILQDICRAEIADLDFALYKPFLPTDEGRKEFTFLYDSRAFNDKWQEGYDISPLQITPDSHHKNCFVEFQFNSDAYSRSDNTTVLKHDWLLYACSVSSGIMQGAIDLLYGKHPDKLTEALYSMGKRCYSGKGAPQDYKEAVKWFRLAAEQGHAAAQTALGLAYKDGKGVPQDYEEAVKWFRISAERGYAPAQVNLGFAYYEGSHAPLNYEEAAKWFRLAAEQGVDLSQYMLAKCYLAGQGVEKSSVEAAKWLSLASEQGYTNAHYLLGLLLSMGGKNAPVNAPKAYALLNLAEAAGNKDATKAKEILEKKMTQQQLEEGQRLSREYAEKFIKN